MSLDDDIKGSSDGGITDEDMVQHEPQSPSEVVAAILGASVAFAMPKRNKPLAVGQRKDGDGGEKKEAGGVVSSSTITTAADDDDDDDNDDETTSVKLLGDPLVSHGPYTFYRALGYRDDNVVKSTKKKRQWRTNRQRRKAGGDGNNSCDSSSSCRYDSSCSCDDQDKLSSSSSSLSSSLSSAKSEWSVVRMNHFYAVRPWYSKKNSSDGDRQQMAQEQRERRRRRRKNSPTSKAVATKRRQHHHQQSVCIGELELLWRDDSVVTGKSTAKRKSNRRATTTAASASNGRGGGVAAATSDEDENGSGLTAVPRRRMLPRRTRQPSAKKLEAAESFAAASGGHQSSYRKSHHQPPATTATSLGRRAPPPSSGGSSSHYAHGNLLCSVRLYVMPDQTAAGRLGGVHGEDEVLEINTWGGGGSNGGGGGDGTDNGMFINGGGGGVGFIYNGGGGGDDYGYGSGSHHSSGTSLSSSGCSGLVLRVEDFIEWIRGGLMNDDDDDDDDENTENDTESGDDDDEELDDESLIKVGDGRSGTDNNRKSANVDEQQADAKRQAAIDVKPKTAEVKTEFDSEQSEQKLSKTINKVKLESSSSVGADKVKKEFVDDPVTSSSSSSSSIGSLDASKKDKHVWSEVKNKRGEEVTLTDGGGNAEKVTKSKLSADGNDKRTSKSVFDQAIDAERVPLAAAKILEEYHSGGDFQRHRPHCRHRRRRQHHFNCKFFKNDGKDNGGSTIAAKQERSITAEHKANKKCDGRTSYNSSKQRLIVMSYSRYCRYRAQLQRSHEELLNYGDTREDNNEEKTAASVHRDLDTINTVRVLFCRDTYDYPAELLLQPFNLQHGRQQENTAVLVNHMAPKLKGWPAHPASWMSFRWNRVRRRLRHMERGNSNNDEQRRRRRRQKLKKKSHRRQNGANTSAVVSVGYSSSTDNGDSDDTDTDGSSATNDGATNTTTTASTSDSDGTPPSLTVMSKTANKNYSVASTKENGGGHHNNRKSLSVSSSGNTIVINGTTVTAISTNNKRTAVNTVQSNQEQQPTKRRRFVCTSEVDQPSQQVVHQKQQHQNSRSTQSQQLYQQFNQFSPSERKHMVVQQQQQQKFQSLNRRLPSPISSLHSSTTRLIHHHLPPSVSIMPVIVPNTSTSAVHQQQQRFNNRLQNRPKPHTTVSVTQKQNKNDSQQTYIPSVMIEYRKSRELKLNDNGRQKKSTFAAVIAACQRNVEDEEDQIQQREDEERQRRWLVNALRLGGLEVTAVPLKNKITCENSKETSSETLQCQQQQSRQNKDNEFHNGSIGHTFQYYDDDDEDDDDDDGDDDDDDDDISNPDSDTNSVVMTVTPDVISMLNKPQEQQTSPDNSSSLTSTHDQQHRQPSVTMNNSNGGSNQPQHKSSSEVVNAPALHDKINRAIDSLKQQQKKQTSNNGNNLQTTEGFNPYQYNNDSNKLQEQKQRKLDVPGLKVRQSLSTKPPIPALLDLSAKPLTLPNNTTNVRSQRSLVVVNSNPQHQQQKRKSILPLHSDSVSASSVSSPSANLEISIVPVSASTTTNVTRCQPQRQPKFSSIGPIPNVSISDSEQSSPMTVRQQLQRRNVITTPTASASLSIIDMVYSGDTRQHQQRSNDGSLSMVTTEPLSRQLHQILKTSTSSVDIKTKQLNIKTKAQQNKKN